MKGLYDRDYSVLTEEEIQEKKRLDQESIIPGTVFSTSCYYDYPKAVRHNLSFFPNHLMDVVDLSNTKKLHEQCNEFEKLLNTQITELNIKRFIQDNKYYHIPASILMATVRRISFLCILMIQGPYNNPT